MEATCIQLNSVHLEHPRMAVIAWRWTGHSQIETELESHRPDRIDADASHFSPLNYFTIPGPLSAHRYIQTP
jgi:hypothetical protein